MNNRTVSAAMSVVVLLAATPAAAVTYKGVRQLGGGLRGALTLTTYGTTGVLAAAKIL
jgi:hypothetical protein